MLELKDFITQNMSDITVAEFIQILEKCPQDYKMNFLGDNEPALYINKDTEAVVIDNFSWLCEEYDLDSESEV